MFDWQTVVALSAVATATCYVARHLWREWRSLTQGGCASCILRRYRSIL